MGFRHSIGGEPWSPTPNLFEGEPPFPTPYLFVGRSIVDTLFMLGEVKFRHLIYLGGMSIFDTLFILGGRQIPTPYLFWGEVIFDTLFIWGARGYLFEISCPQINKPSGFCCKIEISGTEGVQFRPFIYLGGLV